MAEHNDFGKIAEDFIAYKYEQNGYTILARNWRLFPAEIDIIAQKDNVLAVVEVKARTLGSQDSPEKAVNTKKKRLLIVAADAFIQEKELDLECRFDIALVIKQPDGLASTIITDAFSPHEV